MRQNFIQQMVIKKPDVEAVPINRYSPEVIGYCHVDPRNQWQGIIAGVEHEALIGKAPINI